jgi:transcriptional regulator with XRE-family HTH domain
MGEHKAKQKCPACRYTLLSAYNTDPLCMACLRAARSSEGVTPTWLWDSAPLRQALARADMGAVLAILRGAADMSQLDFGQLLGWSQSVVTKIERRQRRTFHDVDEILKVCDLLGMPREALLPLVLGRPDAILDTDDEVMFWGEGVDRRHFNLMASGLLMAPGLAVAAMIPAPERADNGHVRYLQASLNKLRLLDRSAGDGRQLSQVVQVYRRARTMLDESDYTEQVGRALLVVTADLANLGGWLAYDAGNQQLARSLYNDAALLAGSADDEPLMAQVWANMAQQATQLAWNTGHRGLAREALRFTDRAADAARHIPFPKLHALIAMRRSLVHVQLEDPAAFQAAIGHARRELDRTSHHDEPTWVSFVTDSEITGFEAMGARRLGSPGKAVTLYRTVLDDTSRSPRDLAYYRACLAGTLCDNGDTQTAITEGLAALPQPGERIGSMRLLAQLNPIRTTLGPPDEEFCSRFDSAALMLSSSG